MFRSMQEPSSESSPALSMVYSMLVVIDAVNVMAAYQPVMQVYGSQWRERLEHRKENHTL